MFRQMVCCVLFCMCGVFAQNASLSGVVTDPSGQVVPQVAVYAINSDTGVKRGTVTNDKGSYAIPSMAPGLYLVTAEAKGFQTATSDGLTLDVGQAARLDFRLVIGSTSETVTVSASAAQINSSDGSVGTVVDRSVIENMPLNGRSLQTLIELSPGITITKNSVNSQGQFSVNGQRPDSNYWTVDGASANFGVFAGAQLGQSGGGAQQPFGATGGTNSLISIDAVQEVKIQTSTFAPEYGRTPGAQISMLSRGGTNHFHGNVFDYLRNGRLDANDWFANAHGLPQPQEHQNDFGGTFGGPVLRDRTFFFVSYEGLQLRQPAAMVVEVPSLAMRTAVSPALQPFLNATPIPNGPILADGNAQFSAAYSNPTTLNATSGRLDQIISSKATGFVRFNYAPSKSSSAMRTLADNNNVEFLTETLTGGITLILNPRMSDDMRVNYSRAEGYNYYSLTTLGGAVPLTAAQAFPIGTAQDNLFAFAGPPGALWYEAGVNSRNFQRQINVTNTLAMIRQTHQFKFGIDYRYLYPTLGVEGRLYEPVFTTQAQLLSGQASSGSLSSSTPREPTFTNFSSFAQDTWKVTRRLTITYGVRWDITLPPGYRDGHYPFFINNPDTPASWNFAPVGTSLWKTNWHALAPRFGLAYRLNQAGTWVVRGGFGIFYDLGIGSASNIFSSTAPYGASAVIPNYSFPVSAATLASQLPALGFVPPYTAAVYAFPSNLRVPYSYEWNVATQRALGSKQTLTVSYVASLGRDLLRQEDTLKLNPTFPSVLITRNTARSNYQGLQVQFERRLANGLQVLAGYTWSKSLDNLSDDSSFSFPAGTNPALLALEWGPSSFDIGQTFNGAVTYNLPAPGSSAMVKRIFGNWAIDGMFHARTGDPLNVTTGQDPLGLGIAGSSGYGRPDLVPGVPVYLYGSQYPGGWILNKAAFSTTTGRQGDLGRNALRGFGMSQVDFTLRREFRLREAMRLQARWDIFNITNHPNFGDPPLILTQATFGTSAAMLGTSLGSGGFSGGFSPLYQVGQPRSMQLSLKLMF